jgi:hypothetical protein
MESIVFFDQAGNVLQTAEGASRFVYKKYNDTGKLLESLTGSISN